MPRPLPRLARTALPIAAAVLGYVALAALAATPALAHEGHGAPLAHLHGWDTHGLAMLAAAAAATAWWLHGGE